jgi:hypothetical protein
VVVMYRFKIFFKNALGFTNRLNGQFLIAHCRNSTQLNRYSNTWITICSAFGTRADVGLDLARRPAWARSHMARFIFLMSDTR